MSLSLAMPKSWWFDLKKPITSPVLGGGELRGARTRQERGVTTLPKVGGRGVTTREVREHPTEGVDVALLRHGKFIIGGPCKVGWR